VLWILISWVVIGGILGPISIGYLAPYDGEADGHLAQIEEIRARMRLANWLAAPPVMTWGILMAAVGAVSIRQRAWPPHGIAWPFRIRQTAGATSWCGIFLLLVGLCVTAGMCIVVITVPG
jgi:hypothetical protein